MNQPITSGKNVRPHGNVNSGILNKQWDDTYYSLFDLYQGVNADVANLTRVIAFLQTELSAVSQQIDTLALGSALIVPARNMVTAYPNAAQDASDVTPRNFIDQQSNLVTLPLSGNPVPKTFAYDIFRQQTYVGSDTQVLVTVNSAETYSGDNPINLIDPNQPFWAATVTDQLSSVPDQEQITIEIDLSTAVITDYGADTIVFIPHPLYTMSISNLQYNLTGSWIDVPGFTEASNITASRWCFPLINAVKYRFTLTQPVYAIDGAQAIFTFGGQTFGVFNQAYQSTGIVLSQFNIAPGSTVSAITHNFANASCLGVSGESFTTRQPFFLFELYTEGTDGTLTYLPSWSNISASTVWVRTVLNMVSGCTPALCSVVLTIT